MGRSKATTTTMAAAAAAAAATGTPQVGTSMLVAAAVATAGGPSGMSAASLLKKQRMAVPPTPVAPSSPASEVTSEWTPFSQGSKEQGTQPFGKLCPKLKQNIIF